jgi:hypothetical protein
LETDVTPDVPTAKLTVSREKDGRLRAWLRLLPDNEKLVDFAIYEAFTSFDELTVVPGRRSEIKLPPAVVAQLLDLTAAMQDAFEAVPAS